MGNTHTGPHAKLKTKNRKTALRTAIHLSLGALGQTSSYEYSAYLIRAWQQKSIAAWYKVQNIASATMYVAH